MSDEGRHLPDSITRPLTGEVAFLGAITASVTHELNNVISIIDQTGGLLDDLIAGEERGVPLSIERLAGLSESIQKQTRRGLEIIERLNKFAHTTDRPSLQFDLNAVAGNLVELCRRLAGLRRVELQFEPDMSLVRMCGGAMAIQQAVFEIIRMLLRDMETGGSITVTVGQEPERARVTVACSGEVAIEDEQLTPMRRLLESADGTIELREVDGGTAICLECSSAVTHGIGQGNRG